MPTYLQSRWQKTCRLSCGLTAVLRTSKQNISSRTGQEAAGVIGAWMADPTLSPARTCVVAVAFPIKTPTCSIPRDVTSALRRSLHKHRSAGICKRGITSIQSIAGRCGYWAEVFTDANSRETAAKLQDGLYVWTVDHPLCCWAWFPQPHRPYVSETGRLLRTGQ